MQRERHASVLSSVRSWLRPGGVFAGTLGTSDSPEDREEDFFCASMSWSHFDAETNRRLLDEAGFHVEQADDVFDEDEWALWFVATS